ncbi:MAG: glycosyltransferase family 2 protein [Aggregatilineales bacterium]
MSGLFSVIIPNWDGIQYLPTCLDALRSQTYPSVEVILADNASADGSRELLAARYPEVCVITLPRNQGFTGACNAGLKVARGEYLALLNNDTEVEPTWIAEVVAAFERHPEAGAVASKMRLFDRRDHLHTAGDLYRVDGLPVNRGVWQPDHGQYDDEMDVFSACGGSAAYRRAALDEVGLLDDAFFFSCEDVDLGWRLQLAGWRCVYAPRAVVYHRLAATGGGVTASFYDGRNVIYILVKDYPTALWRKHVGAIALAQLRQATQAIRAWRGAAARARLHGMIAGIVRVPWLFAKRRKVQATRRVSIQTLEASLTPITGES